MIYLRIIILIFALFSAGLALILIRFSSSLSRDEGTEGREPFIDSCPHCGGRSELRTFTNYDGQISYATGAVVCTQCGAQTKEEIVSGHYGISVEPATIIQKWNRRYGR